AKSFIQYSDDQGLNWHNLEPALSGSVGYDLALCRDRLYSARHNGLWRLDLTTPTREPGREQPALGQNFPNPFSMSTQIPVALARPEWVELAIFDATGQLVQRLWKGELPAGTHQLPVHATDWPAGIYFYRLQTKAGTAVRQMIRQ
ncbi:MAG: T9SS type A sorting domain-containing protein, partial [Saprospiraceae bacterium]|nr:T9SS type A sorting domain-containing protein [Saprospiraceae bacterium]